MNVKPCFRAPTEENDRVGGDLKEQQRGEKCQRIKEAEEGGKKQTSVRSRIFYGGLKCSTPLNGDSVRSVGTAGASLPFVFLRMNTRANRHLLDAKNKIDCNFFFFFLLYRLFFLSFSFEMMGCCTSQSMLLFLNMFQTPTGALNLNHIVLHFD